MKPFISFLLISVMVLLGCNATSNAVASDTATLTFFHTNDYMGYLVPCG
jgi:hypothetical protein